MGTNIASQASIFVKNVGKNLQGESLDGGASLAVKRKINDVTYSARITESTVTNVGSFKGAWVQIAKPIGPTMNGILTYDLGVKAFTAQIINSRKFSEGRLLDLGLLYKEKNNEVVLTAAAKPHKQHRLNATLTPSTKALLAAYLIEKGSWSLQPSYDFSKKAAVIGVSKKLSNSTVSVNYAVKDKGAAISWTRKPFTLLAKQKIGREGFVGKPTLGITFNQDYLVRDAPIKKAAEDLQADIKAAGKKVEQQVKKAEDKVKAALKKESAQGKKAATSAQKGASKAAAKGKQAVVEEKNAIVVKLEEIGKAVQEFVDNLLPKAPPPPPPPPPPKKRFWLW